MSSTVFVTLPRSQFSREIPIQQFSGEFTWHHPIFISHFLYKFIPEKKEPVLQYMYVVVVVDVVC